MHLLQMSKASDELMIFLVINLPGKITLHNIQFHNYELV